MINAFTSCGNARERTRRMKNEKQGEIFAAAEPAFSMRNALDEASPQWRPRTYF
jgi:hypothetical protein